MSKTIMNYINIQKSHIRVFTLFLLTALFITGCGSVGSGSSDEETDTPTADPTRTIAFTSASVSTLSIVGAGGDTETTLTFTVTDTDAAAPVSGVEVTFSVNDPGSTGASISATSPISAADGTVTATIQSSSTAGTVSVIATITDTTTSVTSAQIPIIGLTPDQIGFVSTSTFTLNYLGSGGTDQTTLTFNVTNTNNAPVSGADVTFSLNDPQNTSAALVSTTATSDGNGAVSVVVNSGNSDGEFTVTATITGSTISETSPDITVTDLATDQITFVSTSTDTLAYQDSGGIDQAVLIFNVSNQAGDPLQGVNVTFEINDLGGTSISLTDTVATSDVNGDVSTTVQSGTIPGVFSVTAFVNSTTTITSAPLIVSAGLPVQNRFSLSATVLNPANAHDTDGITSTINVIASDILGNPVPDGTQIRFVSPESGTIEPSCSTADNGRCSVTWTSAAPRPANGRFTILGYVNGVERFTDNNGNGVFDGSDTFNVSDDTGEPYADGIENNAYDLGEFFLDNNTDLIRSSGDGSWTTGGIVVFNNIDLVMPTDSIRLISSSFAENSTIDVSGGTQTLTVSFTDSYVPPDAENPSGFINPLPLGTTIVFSTNNGAIVGPSSFTQLNTAFGPSNYSIILDTDGSAGTTGSRLLTVEVTTPDGTIDTFVWQVDD
ncbi:MAG: hypothetical protein ACRBCI_01730 [Cellvibrionaceae bacterium]